jgi:hypothetical protein
MTDPPWKYIGLNQQANEYGHAEPVIERGI